MSTPGRKVLHLIDTGGPGGAETVFAQVATGLTSRGFDNIAVVSRDAWLANRIRSGGLEPRILPAKGSLNRKYLAGIVQLIREERPDVLVTHLLGPAVYGSVAGLWTGTPVRGGTARPERPRPVRAISRSQGGPHPSRRVERRVRL